MFTRRYRLDDQDGAIVEHRVYISQTVSDSIHLILSGKKRDFSLHNILLSLNSIEIVDNHKLFLA